MTVTIQYAKKSKDRSPTFPFINLERAIERARQFYDEEKRGIAPYSRAVLHWKYSEASSGGLQTVAALKNYGLVTEPPSTGAMRHLQLTDLALRILLDTRPDSEERAAFIREASSKPAVAAEVYGKWPGSLPSDSTLNHFLSLEKKFTEETAAKVTRILKENHEFARMGIAHVQSSDDGNEADYMTGTELQIQASDPVKSGAKPAPAPTKATPFMEQLLGLDGKTTTTLHFSDTPTPSVYRWIAVYANLKAEQLEKSIQQGQPDQ